MRRTTAPVSTKGTAIDTHASGTGDQREAGPPEAATQVDLSGVKALRSVLRIRPFRRLWLVLSVASLADWMGLLATAIFASLQVEGEAAKGLAFGSSIAVRLVPALLLGPVAGVLADRFDRRYTMVACDILRCLLFASIPLLAVASDNAGLTVGWLMIATLLAETVTLIWLPAKEAAVPNLIPRARLEISNQLSLITTYGITPVLAALSLSALDRIIRSAGVATLPEWAQPTYLALYLNSLARFATALVVLLGIKEISGRGIDRSASSAQGVLKQFMDGWRYVGKTPLVRGLVLGILGAFAGGGIVIGTAPFFAASLNAGDAGFYLLFGTLFIGLGAGIGLGPMIVRELSRRRWFGMSIVLASGSVMFLAWAIHLSMAVLGAILVGAGAGMAFLAGTTLLGGEVGDEVRGRVFAVVQTGTRVILMLAIGLSGTIVGVGGSRQLSLGGIASLQISSTRVLLFAAGLFGLAAGVSAFRQMDDKRGVPVLADLWGSMRGRPLSPTEPFAGQGVFIVFEGGEGAGKSTQLTSLAQALRAAGHDVEVTREPGATKIGMRVRSLLLDRAHREADEVPLTPRAEALLYAADRAHHVAAVVRPALARGAVVLCDRYVDSSLAYQGAGRALPVDEVSWLSSWATGGLKPDLVVLLDVDPAVGLVRVAARGAADRLETESLAFHDRVRYAFLDLAAADPKRYLVVDGAKPTQEIAAAVLNRVMALIPAPAEKDQSGADDSPFPVHVSPAGAPSDDLVVGSSDRVAGGTGSAAPNARGGTGSASMGSTGGTGLDADGAVEPRS